MKNINMNDFTKSAIVTTPAAADLERNPQVHTLIALCAEFDGFNADQNVFFIQPSELDDDAYQDAAQSGMLYTVVHLVYHDKPEATSETEYNLTLCDLAAQACIKAGYIKLNKVLKNTRINRLTKCVAV